MEFFRKTLDPVFALAAIAVLDIFLFLLARRLDGGRRRDHDDRADGPGRPRRRPAAHSLLEHRLPAACRLLEDLHQPRHVLRRLRRRGAVSKEFYWRVPRRPSEWLLITIGGLLMGIGIRLAYICNVFDLLRPDAGNEPRRLSGHLRHPRRRLGRVADLQEDSGRLRTLMTPVVECLVAFLFGSVVGLLMQRSRFCNTAALRDAIMFKTYRNTKAMLVAMMILTVGFTGFMSVGARPPDAVRRRPQHLRRPVPVRHRHGAGRRLHGVHLGEGGRGQHRRRCGRCCSPSSACSCSRWSGRGTGGRRRRRP